MSDESELMAAARRAVNAFEAYGKAGTVVDNARAHQECEAALFALAAIVDGDRYTITEAGLAALEGKK